MKTIPQLFVALALFASSGMALADRDHDDRRGHGHGYDRDHDRGHGDHRYYRDDRRYYGHRHGPQRWARGERYYGPSYVVRDYGYYRLRPPPYGYHWVRDDRSYLLVSMGSGVILDMVIR
ncbi:RcnB family protein [Dyella subtropica]|uniref:RcnB family protein n=1 Tax=Dyella subtropica TaxID=2992127 RepID=UPI0022514BD8|nr:RcnB family protein [Dyella subtropica]